MAKDLTGTGSELGGAGWKRRVAVTARLTDVSMRANMQGYKTPRKSMLASLGAQK
jgi:hypothetical protein